MATSPCGSTNKRPQGGVTQHKYLPWAEHNSTEPTGKHATTPIILVNDFLAQGLLTTSEQELVLNDAAAANGVTPENLRQMIEQQLERLRPDEQRVLEAASVAGMEFSAAAVAAGVAMRGEEGEACCAGVARRGQFVRASGTAEWPDGTIAARYSFLHALYQEVIYEQVPAAKRIGLHRRIGEWEEQAYGYLFSYQPLTFSFCVNADYSSLAVYAHFSPTLRSAAR